MLLALYKRKQRAFQFIKTWSIVLFSTILQKQQQQILPGYIIASQAQLNFRRKGTIVKPAALLTSQEDVIADRFLHQVSLGLGGIFGGIVST